MNRTRTVTVIQWPDSPDSLKCPVSSPGSTFNLDTVYEDFIKILEAVESETHVAPLIELRHLSVPAAVLGPPLAQPPGLSAKVVLRVQLSSLSLAVSLTLQRYS